jgi:hypothetical protein
VFDSSVTAPRIGHEPYHRMIPLWLIDWILDGSALILSLCLAAFVCDLSRQDVATLLACCAIYATHEAWETGLIGGNSHRAVEQLIASVV